MPKEATFDNLFEHGATWLRADFHLHTKADKEFDKYTDEDNAFVKQYVQRLSEEEIGVAVITNHNKFDKVEYKAIAKCARKAGILVLPGVELSVNDGRNNLHTLIVFHPTQWFEHDDFINRFLGEVFSGKPKQSYENENGRTEDALIPILQCLDKSERDYFVIMAHVEQKSGLFEEIGGGKLQEFAAKPEFQNRVLGLQKVRTKTHDSLRQLFGEYNPAFVEGSDAKSLEQIGKGERCYIKIGAPTFEAVKYALQSHSLRVAAKKPEPHHSFIKAVRFEGKNTLNARFDEELNAIIGTRGSGKSSLLEALRYMLDTESFPSLLPLAKSDYKQGLVGNVQGSGGNIEMDVVHKGKLYTLRRIYGEAARIFQNGEELTTISPRSILPKVLYFGQKDLELLGGKDNAGLLIEKLLGDSVHAVRMDINRIVAEIRQYITTERALDTFLAQKDELDAKIKDIHFKQAQFAEHGIGEKLKKQIAFEEDKRTLENFVRMMQEQIDLFTPIAFALIGNGFTALVNSAENEDIISRAKESFGRFSEAMNRIGAIGEILTREKETMRSLRDEMRKRITDLQEEFAQIKRTINLPNLDADTYLQLTRTLSTTQAKLGELAKKEFERASTKEKYTNALKRLEELRKKEFSIIQTRIEAINQSNAARNTLRIEATFEGNRESFLNFLQEIVKGSNLQKSFLNSMIEQDSNGISLWRTVCEPSSEPRVMKLREKMSEHLEDCITFRTPDTFTLTYQGRTLETYSLGQSTSALMTFLLSLPEYDVLIIDQPEDDLDNQTLYEEIIAQLRKQKRHGILNATTEQTEERGAMQCIFATHNPNIPVLADADQVHVCHYEDGRWSIAHSGSIDSEAIQEEIIRIMEGGRRAFQERQKRYNEWTH
jgi:chromosome segregation protein